MNKRNEEKNHEKKQQDTFQTSFMKSKNNCGVLKGKCDNHTCNFRFR